MNRDSEDYVTLVVKGREGKKRSAEPVTFGLPFPRGRVVDPKCLTLWDGNGRQRPLQSEVLTRWFDGSAKWLLLDFQVDLEPDTSGVYRLRWFGDAQADGQCPLFVEEQTDCVIVNTGAAVFYLNRRFCKPFDRVVVGGNEVLQPEGSLLSLADESQNLFLPYYDELRIACAGPVRASLRGSGELKSSKKRLARFVVQLNFFAGSRSVEAQLTLHNPRAARHQGGLWDLGDVGSIYFKDFSLSLPVRSGKTPRVFWTTDPACELKHSESTKLAIYQDSSGGENWRSSNHVNRFGEVKHAFRGYRVSTGGGALLEEGYRATPIVSVANDNGRIDAAIEQFWQNFPKALEAHGHELVLRLFPGQYDDLFELQGGEQKTHKVYLHFSEPSDQPPDVSWVHDRLVPRATAEWYAETKACPYLSPSNAASDNECDDLINTAIEAPRSFFERREVIDEYGWRHFGDLYADHESVGHRGEAPLVAHYNNQYDVIYGALVAYLRGGDARWFALACDLACHVIDIDIYHTYEDRPVYNGGLFWHTDHYLDAGTATHRTYSKASLKVKEASSYGGGPSNEQNYTAGLLHYYYLTGNEAARAAVLSLADWVINMDDGSKRTLGFVDRRPTGLASCTVSSDYHGPGRGAGNSINAVLDAFALTDDDRYFKKADELIRRCIHPKDEIASRNLDDPERRWSYLVFLQALGKYLEVKLGRGEVDFMYAYAQESLLRYARWMLTNEVPYSTKLDRVEFPTETWPAQDIRKCVVFHLAAKHATASEREAFSEKAKFFFNSCIKDLRAFPTCMFTRPLVLLLTNAYVNSYFEIKHSEAAPRPVEHFDFGTPSRFKPQFYEVQWLRHTLLKAVRNLRTTRRGVFRGAAQAALSEGKNG